MHLFSSSVARWWEYKSVEALKWAEIARGMYTSGDKSEEVILCYERKRKECIDIGAYAWS